MKSIYLPETLKLFNMRKFLILLFLMIGLLRQDLKAQSADSVKAVINQLFQGMKTSDSTMVRDAFADSAILQTIGHDKQGEVIIENEKVEEFAKLVSGLKKGSADVNPGVPAHPDEHSP